MGIAHFFNQPRNSRTREALFNYKFFYDLKLAAAKNESDVQVYIPEIDREGYDVILDDGDKMKVFQLKTVLKTSPARTWRVQKQLLRPDSDSALAFGYERDPEHVGLQGGFVLAKIEATEDSIIQMEYLYTDICVLMAFKLGILSCMNSNEDIINRAIRELFIGGRNERIVVPKSLMVNVQSAENILAISDMQSETRNEWVRFLVDYARRRRIRDREEVVNRLRMLLNDRRMTIE
jgi:hypothetical protein